jgi:VanZ family protein
VGDNHSIWERLRPHARLLTGCWVAYWIGLTVLLHAPKLPKSPIEISKRSLVAHFLTFSLLAAGRIVTQRVRGGPITDLWIARWVGVFAAYATASELLQPLSVRHSDIYDWLANAGGIVVGSLVARLLVNRRLKVEG